MEPYQLPYQYVIDSSALFDLKRIYPQNIFPGVWQNFNRICKQKLVIAPREVLIEVRKGNDELLDWVEQFGQIFLEPEDKEYDLIQQVISVYPASIIEKNSIGRPWADPFVIACAMHYKLKIIQHENPDPKQFKIPSVAKQFNISCIRLVDLFEREGWEFISL